MRTVIAIVGRYQSPVFGVLGLLLLSSFACNDELRRAMARRRHSSTYRLFAKDHRTTDKHTTPDLPVPATQLLDLLQFGLHS